MNCKPGDLAIVVRSASGNEGRIVRVDAFIGKVPGYLGNDRWRVSGARLTGTYGEPVNHLKDSQLRPIRPGDLEDETPTVREREAA